MISKNKPASRVDDLRQRRTARGGIARVTAVVGDDAVGAHRQAAGGAGGGLAVAAAPKGDRAAPADRKSVV